MKKDFLYWFRWLTFLPAGVIAGFLASIPLHFMLYLTLTKYIEPYPETPERLAFPYLFFGILIVIAYKVVPEYKLRISYILAGICTLLIVASFFMGTFGLNIAGIYFNYDNSWLMLIPVTAITGVATAIAEIRKEEKKSSQEV